MPFELISVAFCQSLFQSGQGSDCQSTSLYHPLYPICRWSVNCYLANKAAGHMLVINFQVFGNVMLQSSHLWNMLPIGGCQWVIGVRIKIEKPHPGKSRLIPGYPGITLPVTYPWTSRYKSWLKSCFGICKDKILVMGYPSSYNQFGIGRRFAAALLPRLFGTNPRSHHMGATGRVRTGDQRLPVL